MDQTEYLNLVTKYRQDLHQIPELSFDLFKTSEYIKQTLDELGYDVEMVAKTGIIAVKKGKVKEAIAFRADMDALAVNEKTSVHFASKHANHMHACGHDGHMSILLGFAKYLTTQCVPNKTIVLIFQPAEESPGGARVIIEAGVFKRYCIQSIFAIHLYPGLDEGKIGMVNGAMMAQNGEFDISVNGVSSHGAEPHLGSDAVLAGSVLVSNYHTIVSRNLDPLAPAVITIGTINGGEARNIIAQQVTLAGTIRSFNETQYHFIKARLIEINNAVELMHRVKVDCEIRDYYPPVINDQTLFEIVKNSLAIDEYQLLKPMMFAEDFAFYQQVVPGLLMMLGTKNEEKNFSHPLHSCYFNFDESVLVRGIELYIKICESLNIL